jgi:hypothetical protein
VTDEQKALEAKLVANRKLRKRLREQHGVESLKMRLLLAEGVDLGITVDRLARLAGISRWSFYRRMRGE